MRKTLFALTTAAAAVTAGTALAGGVAEPVVVAPAPAPIAPAPVSDWTGIYGGVQLEFLDGEDSGGVGRDADFDGTLVGLFGGYRYDFGNIVAGVEIDFMTGSGEYDPTTGPVEDLDYNSLVRLGVELGVDAGPALLYGTVGYAHLEIGSLGTTFDDDGYFFGVGADFRVNDNITVGGEVLYHDFSDFVTPGNNLDATTFGVNVAFTF